MSLRSNPRPSLLPRGEEEEREGIRRLNPAIFFRTLADLGERLLPGELSGEWSVAGLESRLGP